MFVFLLPPLRFFWGSKRRVRLQRCPSHRHRLPDHCCHTSAPPKGIGEKSWWVLPLKLTRVFPTIGVITPKWMVYDVKTLLKMDDLRVPLFLETPTWPRKIGRNPKGKRSSSNHPFFWCELLVSRRVDHGISDILVVVENGKEHV